MGAFDQALADHDFGVIDASVAVVAFDPAIGVQNALDTFWVSSHVVFFFRVVVEVSPGRCSRRLSPPNSRWKIRTSWEMASF